EVRFFQGVLILIGVTLGGHEMSVREIKEKILNGQELSEKDLEKIGCNELSDVIVFQKDLVDVFWDYSSHDLILAIGGLMAERKFRVQVNFCHTGYPDECYQRSQIAEEVVCTHVTVSKWVPKQ